MISFSIRTFIRTFDWRDELTLGRADVALSHGSFDAEQSYGATLLKAGDIDEAGIHLINSVQEEPLLWPNYNTLGVYYGYKDNLVQSESMFRHAIANKKYPLAYENLSIILLQQK